MSWAAHNPEAYEEICINGIVDKMTITESDSDSAIVHEVIEFIAENCPDAFTALVTWAHEKIAKAESSYFTRGI